MSRVWARRPGTDSPEVLTYLRKAALGREEPQGKQLFSAEANSGKAARKWAAEAAGQQVLP